MNMLAHIADRVLGRPLFIHQGKAAMILSVLGERIGVEADAAGVDVPKVLDYVKREFAHTEEEK